MPRTNVILLSICNIKGRVIKIDIKKWTIYLQDNFEPKVRTSEHILQDQMITIETLHFIVGKIHCKIITTKPTEKVSRSHLH